MRILCLVTTVFAVATATVSFAEQEYGGTAAVPQGQYQNQQRWQDSGKPWGDAGRQLKNIWGGIAGDARTIGPATRQDFANKPRWNWSGGDGTAPVYSNAPTQPIRMQQQYAPANPVYLPAESQPLYVPQESYSYPVETVPYSDPVPYSNPVPYVEQVPTYQMAPVN